MTRKDIIEFIPITILSLLGLHSTYIVLTTNYIFGTEQYIGLTLLVISILIFFIDRRVYKYIFSITLFLGLFSLVSFTISIFALDLFGIKIQLLIIPIILIFMTIIKDEIKYKFKEYNTYSDEQIHLAQNSKIKGFKKRFSKLTDDQILIKLNDNLIPEATEALIQIKNERKELKEKN